VNSAISTFSYYTLFSILDLKCYFISVALQLFDGFQLLLLAANKDQAAFSFAMPAEAFLNGI
jgi:hypothetical protein